ncbi:hypothetical protein ZEAMMB73_Zm00001d010381 [Zea mays]|uniref:Uncharacterized protein n=1 Tax=Zea mays TaxID=4577 RepID=A0A1D6FQQ2_MAIZE|nr:hypothetical protein ZEAMMB73_Zm00001d010381 [Zea mays]
MSEHPASRSSLRLRPTRSPPSGSAASTSPPTRRRRRGPHPCTSARRRLHIRMPSPPTSPTRRLRRRRSRCAAPGSAPSAGARARCWGRRPAHGTPPPPLPLGWLLAVVPSAATKRCCRRSSVSQRRCRQSWILRRPCL